MEAACDAPHSTRDGKPCHLCPTQNVSLTAKTKTAEFLASYFSQRHLSLRGMKTLQVGKHRARFIGSSVTSRPTLLPKQPLPGLSAVERLHILEQILMHVSVLRLPFDSQMVELDSFESDGKVSSIRPLERNQTVFRKVANDYHRRELSYLWNRTRNLMKLDSLHHFRTWRSCQNLCSSCS